MVNIEKEEDKQMIRNRATSVIFNYYRRSQRENTSNKDLKKKFNLTKKFLNEREHIIVSKSDKGNNTVVMYKEEYKNEVKRML